MDNTKENVAVSEILSEHKPMLVSKEDRVVKSNGLVLKPGDLVALPFDGKIPVGMEDKVWDISIRSVLAQGGLNANISREKGNARNLVITNLHPINSYYFPKGEIAVGRIYKRGTSLDGNLLETVVNQIMSANNSLSPSEIIEIDGNELVLPIDKNYWKIPHSFPEKGNIDITSLPSGEKRWLVKSTLGIRGSEESGLPSEQFPIEGFRLLVTPLVKVPQDLMLEITNPDHLSSRLIDGGFEHLIVCEFSDKLSDEKTVDKLRLRVYKKQYF